MLVFCFFFVFFVTSGISYLSTRLVVVKVHQAAGVFLDLASVYKAAGKLHAVLDVG